MRIDSTPDDSFVWRVNIDQDTTGYRTVDGRYITEAGPRSVEMTLYDVDQAEAKAVIALINDMRRGVRNAQPEAPRPEPGGRFANLDF